MKSNKIILAFFICSAFCLSAFAGGKKEAPAKVQEPAASTSDSEIDIESTEQNSVLESDSKKENTSDIRVGILNGPTAISAAYMLENVKNVADSSISFTKFADPQALLPKMLKGEIDIGFLPANIAAKVYNSSNGTIICAGTSGYGNLSVLTKDTSVQSLADLCGKKVTIAGQGATPEYLFRMLLKNSGIETGDDADKVSLDFSIPTSNIAAALLSDKIKYAVVPEPFATVAMMKSSSVVRVIDLQDEYEAAVGNNEKYPLTVVVVRKAFASLYQDQVKAFLAAFNESVAWTIANPQKAGVYVQRNTLGLMAPVVAKSIPYCNFTYVSATESRPFIEKLLGIFIEFAPESVGAKLPDDGFYFN